MPDEKPPIPQIPLASRQVKPFVTVNVDPMHGAIGIDSNVQDNIVKVGMLMFGILGIFNAAQQAPSKILRPL